MNNQNEIIELQNKITELSISQNKLLKNNEFLNSIIDKQPGYAYRVKCTGNKTPIYISDGVELITGYSRTDYIMGLAILHKTEVLKADREKVAECINEFTSYNVPYEIMYRITTLSGDEKWVWDRGNGIYDDYNKLIEIEGFVTEVTKMKKGDDTIRESEQRFRSLFESTYESIMILDNNEFLDCNQKTLDFFEIKSKKDFTKLNFALISPQFQPNGRESLEYINELIFDAIKSGTKNFEWTYKKRKGNNFVANILFSRLKLKDKVVLQATIRDITEQKKVEDLQLKLSKGIDQSSVSILITDVNGQIEFVNPKFTQVTGYSYDEVIGQNSRIFKSGDKSDEDYKKIWQQLKSGKVWKGEFLNKKKNGELYWESTSIAPIENFKGEITHYIAVKEDITAKKIELKKLIENSEKNISLIGDLQIGILIQGPNAEILMNNPKSLELLGLSEDQLLGKTSFDPSWNVIHEDGTDFPGNTHPVPRAIECKEPICNVVMGVFRPNSGDRIWLLVNAEPKLDIDGAIQNVLCTFVDITFRINAKRELIKSQSLIESIANNIPDGAIFQLIVNNDLTEFKIPYISSNAILFGLEIEEIYKDANVMFKDIHKDDIISVMDAIRKSKDDLTTFDIKYRIELNGKTTWAHIKSSPSRLNNGDTLWEGIIFDITKYRNAYFQDSKN